MKKRRWAVIASISAAVALAIIYGFMPKPVPVDLAYVSRGPMMVTVVEEGTTRVKDRFVVSAPVAGFLNRIKFKPGDAVKKGQAAAVLSPMRSAPLDSRSAKEAEAASKAAASAFEAARQEALAKEAQASLAQKELQRVKGLHEAGFMSNSALEQAESEAEIGRAASEAAKAAERAALHGLERARAALEFPSVLPGRTVAAIAPHGGMILKVFRESEGAVMAGEPLLEIGDTKSLDVRVEALSSDAVNIKAGMPVILERWGGGSDLRGVVRKVEPSAFTKLSSLGVEEQRVVVIADIASPFADWQGLGDGYRLEAKFVLWEGSDVLQVPASALFRTGDKWALFAVEKDRARVRTVEVGRRNGLWAEILSGLKEGDAVVSHPDSSVEDGSRIRPRRQ